MRILGITVPEKKRLEMGLTVFYGIGRARAKKILSDSRVEFGKKPNELSVDEEGRIRKIVESLKLGGDLKREIGANIKRLKDIKCYRGTRHLKRLPVRGQRTKTNSRTIRGNIRRTMGSGRRKTEKT